MQKLPRKPHRKHRFPCEQCGALLKFAPGSSALECSHCGHRQPIAPSDRPILEHDFAQALERLAHSGAATAEPLALKCSNCAADFELPAGEHAGACPYCSTPVVVDPALLKPFQPESLLPFRLDQRQAWDAFRKWLGSLWFAPGALKRYARGESRLKGVYIPYWTYDSQTQTRFRGQRGDVYYVTQTFTTVRNGRSVRQTKRVPRIRWTPVSGQVQRHFDDVLIGASTTLPRQLTDPLAPWDLQQLVPFDQAYLSGFGSEIYQVGLDAGFDYARGVMEQVIRGDIRRRIGGDQQRIDRLHTEHRDTRFKGLLLPVWMAEFRFRGKPYRFVVNARTGKTRGERPYSYLKIVAAVLLGLAAAGGLLYLLAETGVLAQLLEGSAYLY